MKLPWSRKKPPGVKRSSRYTVRVSLVITHRADDPMIADLQEVHERSAVTDNLDGARALMRTYAEFVGSEARW